MSSSQIFLLLHIFKSRNEKAPYRGRVWEGGVPPPPLGRYDPSQRLRPQMFWLITPLGKIINPISQDKDFMTWFRPGGGGGGHFHIEGDGDVPLDRV